MSGIGDRRVGSDAHAKVWDLIAAHVDMCGGDRDRKYKTRMGMVVALERAIDARAAELVAARKIIQPGDAVTYVRRGVDTVIGGCHGIVSVVGAERLTLDDGKRIDRRTVISINGTECGAMTAGEVMSTDRWQRGEVAVEVRGGHAWRMQVAATRAGLIAVASRSSIDHGATWTSWQRTDVTPQFLAMHAFAVDLPTPAVAP